MTSSHDEQGVDEKGALGPTTLGATHVFLLELFVQRVVKAP